MDSVSQMLLGAACGELVLGRRVGRRAILIGAVLGTLPDLDVLVPYEDAIDSFTYHRSWSHSVFVLTAASVPIAALARRVAGGERGRAVPYGLWLLGVWLILFTHPLLDSFTTYGTQIWWPLPLPPVAIGSVFIIDPLYTLPLAVGVIWAWRRRDARGRAANRVGLQLGTVYLGLTLLSQAHAGRVARASLAAESAVEPAAGSADEPSSQARARAPAELLVAPFPFSLLWRIVALDEEGRVYREGWYSLLDESRGIRFTDHDTGRELLDEFAGDRRVARLAWFTNGFVRARANADGELALTDLRIGAEGSYVFSFAVAERAAEGGGDPDGSDPAGGARDAEAGRLDDEEALMAPWRPVVARQLAPEIDLGALGPLVRRVTDESVELRGSSDGRT